MSVAVASLLVASVYAAVTLTQTFPAVNTAVVTSSCTSLVNEGFPVVPTAGSSGTILFNCAAGSPGTPAFTAITGSSTPTFTLPAGFSSMTIITGAAIPATTPLSSLPSCTAGTTITTGTAASLTAGTYDYCATYTSWPSGGTTSFTITWAN